MRGPMSPAGTIAVVGSINVDLSAQVVRHPRPGETLHGRGGQMTPGGQGANQAVAPAKRRGAVGTIGAAGTGAQAAAGLPGVRPGGGGLAGVRAVAGAP